jgi:hypothetical protein
VPVQISNVPVELCAPTQKTTGRHVANITNPTMHLLRFQSAVHR